MLKYKTLFLDIKELGKMKKKAGIFLTEKNQKETPYMSPVRV